MFATSSPLILEKTSCLLTTADQWCCGDYWVHLGSSWRRADSPYSGVYRVRVCCCVQGRPQSFIKGSTPKGQLNYSLLTGEMGGLREGGLVWRCCYLAMCPPPPPPLRAFLRYERLLFPNLINKISICSEPPPLRFRPLMGFSGLVLCVNLGNDHCLLIVTVGRCQCWWWASCLLLQSSCFTSGGSTPAPKPPQWPHHHHHRLCSSASVDLDQTNHQQVSCAVIKLTGIRFLWPFSHKILLSVSDFFFFLLFICGLHVFDEEEEASSLKAACSLIGLMKTVQGSVTFSFPSKTFLLRAWI